MVYSKKILKYFASFMYISELAHQLLGQSLLHFCGGLRESIDQFKESVFFKFMILSVSGCTVFLFMYLNLV